MGLIKSSDHNSNYSDIATALTQSLATTGVSTMTGQVKAAAGVVTAPSYSFGTSLTTGFYLAGANQIGIATGGAQVGTFNSDQSTTWTGAFTLNATTINGNLTINSTTVTFGAGVANAFWAALVPNFTIGFIIDGGGATITTGQKGYIEAPCNATIKRSTLMADQSTSSVVNVWKVPFGSFPPNSGNKITASAPPTLSAAQSAQDSTLSGWTTTVTAGDILAFNVDSNNNAQRLTLSLLCLRTGS